MRIRSLLLGLGLGVGIVGSSSVALADHDVAPRGDHTYRFAGDQLDGRRGRVDRFDRYDRFDRRGRRHHTWVPLAPPMRQHGRRAVIDVTTYERFGQVRLQNQAGRTYIRAIVIELGDGRRLRVRVDRTLVGHRQRVDIDLPGEARRGERGERIERIVVIGESDRWSRYQVYAI